MSNSDGALVTALLTDLAMMAYESLADTRLGVPEGGYLSHDEPPEDTCDFLALWVRSWTPYLAGQFPTPQAEVARCQRIEWGPSLILSLRRPCSPDLKGDRANPFPEPTDETAAAVDLIEDIRVLQCTVLNDWPTRLQVDFPGAVLLPASIDPTGSTTGCFGWDWEIQMELPSGCRMAC